jgi:hypothetical protein
MTITGGSGNDTIIMKQANDVLDGGTNGTTTNVINDTLNIVQNAVLGGFLIDLTSTTDQVTTYNGSANAAVQKGFENVDLSGVTGTFGADITARAAGSSIVGTLNGDQIAGGAGVDTITGGAGVDVINGGAGNDVFIIIGSAQAVAGNAAIDLIDGSTGTGDELRLSTATTIAGTDILTRITNVEKITSDANAGIVSVTITAVSATGTAFTSIDLSGDTDATSTNVISVTGVTGISTITGSAGIDTITLGAAAIATTVTGGSGADTLSIANVTQTTVADIDGIAITVSGSTVSLITTTTALAATTITGGTGVDTITLAGGVSNVATIIGGDGIDVITLGALHTGSVKVVLGSGGTNVQSVTNFLPGTNTTAVDQIQFDVVGSGETGAFDSATLSIATLSTSAGTTVDSANTAAGATVVINRVNTDTVALAAGVNVLVFTPTYADLTAFVAAIQTAGANTVLTGGDNTQAVHSYPAVWSDGANSYVAIVAIGLNAVDGTTQAATAVSVLTLVGITSTANIDATDFAFI